MFNNIKYNDSIIEEVFIIFRVSKNQKNNKSVGCNLFAKNFVKRN